MVDRTESVQDQITDGIVVSPSLSSPPLPFHCQLTTYIGTYLLSPLLATLTYSR